MKNDWLSIVFRHFATVLLMITLGWTVAKPHVENFVREAVNERITKIENQLTQHGAILSDIVRTLDTIDNKVSPDGNE